MIHTTHLASEKRKKREKERLEVLRWLMIREIEKFKLIHRKKSERGTIYDL